MKTKIIKGASFPILDKRICMLMVMDNFSKKKQSRNNYQLSWKKKLNWQTGFRNILNRVEKKMT
jgi:hypothetical protein